MKKTIAFFVACCLFTLKISAQLVQQSYPQAPGMAISDMCTDALGNLYQAGVFIEMPTPQINQLSVVRKISPNGITLWSGTVAIGSGYGRHTCTDAAGNIFVLGIFTSFNFQLSGGAPLQSFAGEDIFLAKYSPTGNLLWSRSYGSYATDTPTGLTCDADGNVIFSAKAATNLPGPACCVFELGNGITISNSTFIAKVSASGSPIWATTVGSPGETHSYIKGIWSNQAGEVTIGGRFQGPLTIGSTTYGGQGFGAFIAKLDSTGLPIWAKTSNGDALYINSHSLNDGPKVIAGLYTSGISFDTVSLPHANTATNGFIAKYTDNGNLEWARPICTNITAGFNVQAIRLDESENILLAGDFTGSITIDNQTFIAGSLPSQNKLFLGKFGAAGDLIWAIVGKRDSVDVVSNFHTMCLTSNQDCFISGSSLSNPGPSAMTFGGYSSTEFDSFLYRVRTSQANEVGGRIFYDFNSNGVKDSPEPYAPGIITQTSPGNYYSQTSVSGKYSASADSGNYSIAIPFTPPYYVSAPVSYSGFLPGTGISDTTRHFALQPVHGMQDLEITTTAITVPRPGFAYPFLVTYKNVGTTTLSGSAEANLDPQLQLTTTSPAFASQSGNTLIWNFTNLQPQESHTILIETTVPVNTVLGSSIGNSFAADPISGDLTPANNTKTDSALVVGSYDPNDKQVSQNHLTPTEVAAGKYLEYTIRFQNTGTDTAFTVRLIDTLDAQLNIPTFEMLASSHVNTWSIRGNGILEWRFDNILLPDSNTNEAASHGFVKYRIRPNTNLTLGSIIRNTAAIYFDFNEPVITNTATTEVALVSAVVDGHKPKLQVYPNPNKGSFTVQLQNVQEQSVKTELRNVLGQIVWQQNLNAENGNVQQQIKTQNLSKGIYYLQIGTGKGNAVQKVVIE